MKEERAASVAAVGAAAIIAQQTAGKVTRDTLFLSSHDADALPWAMLWAAGLALLGVLLLSRAQVRHGPGRVVSLLALVSGGLFTVEAMAQPWAPSLVAYVVYVHVAVAGAATISGFWSVINERFDPHAARRCVARVALGATAGGVLGSLLAERVAAYLGTGALLGLLAVLSFGCAPLLAALTPARRGSATTAPHRSGLRVLATSPFLRRIGGVVTLLAFATTLADFALKATADATLPADQLASFFSLYYGAVGVATLAVQTLLTRRLLERWGVGSALALLPLVFLALGSAAVVAARLLTVALLRGVTAALDGSLHRSGYELLYTPVAPADKRATKMLIDVAGVRLGDALGSGFVLLAVPLAAPEGVLPIALGLAMLAAAAALALVRQLGRGYVAQLARALDAGAPARDPGSNAAWDLGALVAATSPSCDERTLRLALRTAQGGGHGRGAALEYLHNVLPADVRASLWPRLSPPGAGADDAR